MHLFGLILQQQPAAGNPLYQALPLVLIVGIFYVLVFMPMQKQKKQQASMLESLQSGQEVLTSGGIIATIVSIAGDSMIVRVKPDNIKLQISRASVSTLITEKSGAASISTTATSAGEGKK